LLNIFTLIHTNCKDATNGETEASAAFSCSKSKPRQQHHKNKRLFTP